jgi:hypothetical protein
MHRHHQAGLFGSFEHELVFIAGRADGHKGTSKNGVFLSRMAIDS